MSDPIDFFIDGEPFSTQKASQSVTDVLAIADFSSEHFFLVSPDGTKYLDPYQNITIHSGTYFKTEKRDQSIKPPSLAVIRYLVNGEPQTTINSTLSVEQILQTAGKPASIDLGQINNYILENIKTGRKYQNIADIVDISTDDEFLAVHSGATPVAFLLLP